MEDLITQEEVTKTVKDSINFLNEKLNSKYSERGCYANLNREEIIKVLESFSLVKEYYEL